MPCLNMVCYISAYWVQPYTQMVSVSLLLRTGITWFSHFQTNSWTTAFSDSTMLVEQAWLGHSCRVLVLPDMQTKMDGAVQFVRSLVNLLSIECNFSILAYCCTEHVASTHSVLHMPATNWQTSKLSLLLPSNLEKTYFGEFI